MDTSIGMRIRQLREAKQLSVADFAKAAGVKPSAVYGLESDANRPSLETVANLRQSFPGLNTEWLQFGEGAMFSRELTSLAAEPEAPYASPIQHAAPVPAKDRDLVLGLIERLDAMQQRHVTAIAEQEKEHRKQRRLDAQSWQFTVSSLQSQLGDRTAQLEEKNDTIARLNHEIWNLKLTAGLRAPTEEEQEYFEKQAQLKKEKEEKDKKAAGFKPEGVVGKMMLSHSDPSFIRQPETEEEEMLLQVA